MKKILILCVLVLASMGLFAAGHVGASFYYGYDDFTAKLDKSVDADFKATAIGGMVNGAQFFGDRARFGFGYSLGVAWMDDPEFNDVNVWKANRAKADSDGAAEVNGALTFMYRQPLNDRFAIELGAGVAVGGWTISEDSNVPGDIYDDEFTFIYAGPCAEVDMTYTVANHMAVTAGARCTAITNGNWNYDDNKNSANSHEEDFDADGVVFAGYVGFAYQY